ncbi:hypothetical protein SAMN04487968_10768 [Nocardioides terrae]|uniref:Uncharacterized protein n=1 Tax=Nocardioides terrae TaxID=574651 RepID=A0A1I1JMJ2_9ACTN|nr:hypothetical protein [Nocardioides terrae]SFC49595.1 hypothetical protein SAMN04487968_10768 [Nocardioides terrae]
MVHPVKTPLGIVRGATSVSLNAVRHPLRTAGGVLTLGRGMVGAVVTGHGHDRPLLDPDRAVAEPTGDEPTLKRHGDPVTQSTPAPESSDESSDQTPEPGPVHDPVFTEPSSVTGPGDDEELTSYVGGPEDEDVEVVTPVGTTGAGPGVNPDTTESDLQQPGTEPLMDPSTTKRIKRETDVLRKASDPKKG